MPDNILIDESILNKLVKTLSREDIEKYYIDFDINLIHTQLNNLL